MIRGVVAAATLATVFGALGPEDAAAQLEISSGETTLSFSARIQNQLAHSSVAGGPGANFILRHAWIDFELGLREWLQGRIQYDLATASVKDAYMRVESGASLQFDLGHFKKSFDLFVLQSMADILVIERDGRVPGYEGCAGVGNVCSLARLTRRLGYSDRDYGLRLGGDLGPRLSYEATVTNGTDGQDDNDAKSPAGRLVFALTDRIRVAGNASFRDYQTGAGTTRFGRAWGGDLEVGSYEEEGVHLQAGIVGGNNWRRGLPGGGTATFLAAQAIVSYHRSNESEGRVVAVEPLARVSWADPDTEAPEDQGILITPGFVLFFASRNKIGANVDIYSPERGGTEWSLKVQSYFYF